MTARRGTVIGIVAAVVVAVVAAVVLNEGHELDAEGLRAHVRQHLTAYKVPRRFVTLPDLPRNPMGKVLRREVAEQIAR